MAITVLRVEVDNVSEVKDKNSLAAGDKSKKTETIAAGAVGVHKVIPTAKQKILESHFTDIESTEIIDSISEVKTGGLNKEQNKAANKIATSKGVAGATAILGAGAFIFDHMSTNLELSGATHAAAKLKRGSNMLTTGASLGAALLINPALAPAVIGLKAYQLAQTNKKEIYAIGKAQLESTVMQRNLITNVAERRF